MNYQKLLASCALSFLLATGANALPVSESGQNERVEWQVQQSWATKTKTVDMVHSLDGKYVFILTDQQKVAIYNNQGQLQGSIPVDAGVSAIDIAPQGEFLFLIDNKANTFTSLSISFVVDIDTAGSPFQGPADAPVTIALFTDFECPYCSKIIPLLEQVQEKNPDTVKVVFKNMPLRFHKMAEPSARAAFAAREQGKFWEFHDKLFATKKLSNEAIDKIATELQLDMNKFKKDMASPAIKAKIQKDMIDAQNAGVTGTPTVFINGRKPQQRSPEGFQAIINEELAKKGVK